MAFDRLPNVPTADEVLDTAFKRAKRASPPKVSPGTRIRSQELVRIGTVAKVLSSRLNRIVRGFPSLDELHPFHQDLVDALVGLEELRRHLSRVQWARDTVHRLGEEFKMKLRRQDPPPHIMAQLRRAAQGRMSSVVKDIDDALVFLNEAKQVLRKIPGIDPTAPTLVIAGYPNVGKSSFLATVSNSTPEVAAYPFTTKGLTVGHIDHDRVQVQVIDTPGVLDRPMEERNEIEMQSIIALDHVADAILFVLDPSCTCGYPMEDQLALLKEVQDLFDDVPFLVVEAKCDLGTTGTRPAMSVKDGKGVQEVLAEALELTMGTWQDR